MVSTDTLKFNFLSDQIASSQRFVDTSSRRSSTPSVKKLEDGRCGIIRKRLQSQGLPESASNTIINSWRRGTQKQYGLAWKKWYFWCLRGAINPIHTSETVVIRYLDFLVKQGKSYSVINTHKSMLLQTLQFFDNVWCANPSLIARFMKGLFYSVPPKPKYTFTWDVSVVLNYLSSLFPLETLSLRLLTLKLTALIALSSAPRAQTLMLLNLDCMTVLDKKVVFGFKDLLKTSKQGKSFILELCHFDNEKLCVMHTLTHYIDRTKNHRISSQLLISYCSFKPVTSSTIARWLKTVLFESGIDINQYKAHSFRSAATSAAFSHGCSLSEILKTADWSSAKNFYKFYFRGMDPKNVSFSDAVLTGHERQSS